MSFTHLFVSINLLVAGTSALPATTYALQDTYDYTNWLSRFSVQNIADPTHGFVNYVTQAQAQSEGLLKTIGDQVYIGVDNTTQLDPNGSVGRNSVRLQSNPSYNHALVIADFAHIPVSDCGVWPAFWMVGPNWPNEGEIDIIEGVNLNTYDQVTLHTSSGCVPTIGSGGQTGTPTGNADCGAGGGYTGCGVVSGSATSYGTAFNANGGGVYATLWTSSAIKVWYFPANGVPSDIKSGTPNPAGWGTPIANYAGCGFDAHFQNMNIIFDTTFCGDWAGQVWSSSSCASLNPSCNAYVAEEPQSFGNAYWLVNSIKVYSMS
ncbi:glycoside hydrolase family 16 protein [Cenococcum geophilum 1.58]|uniref:glycoside hydrolase family 16 protein n=1 Tax=Cenococcum geophilum 1.58 TaxID=794803 RepID=UPI00358FABEC|nr:glycoside hydrolase family 16 protein [Cenococcum geophilum 1.58]